MTSSRLQPAAATAAHSSATTTILAITILAPWLCAVRSSGACRDHSSLSTLSLLLQSGVSGLTCDQTAIVVLRSNSWIEFEEHRPALQLQAHAIGHGKSEGFTGCNVSAGLSRLTATVGGSCFVSRDRQHRWATREASSTPNACASNVPADWHVTGRVRVCDQLACAVLCRLHLKQAIGAAVLGLGRGQPGWRERA